MASYSGAVGQDHATLTNQSGRIDYVKTKPISEGVNSKIKVLQLLPTYRMPFGDKIELYQFGKPSHIPKPNKVLLVVGASGAGKTTLINALTNYLMEVKWDSEIRYQLIVEEGSDDQTVSQTQGITAYTFHPSRELPLAIDYSLTIVDTPGFGDTRGREMDKKIRDLLQRLFAIEGSNQIDQIHGVAFVAQAHQVRLTELQKYIIDSVLEIFGVDIKHNIFIACTFCTDPDNIPVLQSLRKAQVHFTHYFGFDNGALYYEPTGNKRKDQKMSLNWEMGEESFQALFATFESASTVSATLTKKVLYNRHQLELILVGLRLHTNQLLAKIDEIGQETMALRRADSAIEESKDYTYTVTVIETKAVKLPQGRKATSCKNCKMTCDRYCFCSDNWKEFCIAINLMTGNCKVCPGNCPSEAHVSDYTYEQLQEEETRTNEHIKKKFHKALSDQKALQAELKQMEKNLQTMNKKALEIIHRSFQCVIQLQQIALRPNTSETENICDHIENLIKQEQDQRQVGWEKRVSYFKGLLNDTAKIEELERMDDTWWKKFVHQWGETMHFIEKRLPGDIKLS